MFECLTKIIKHFLVAGDHIYISTTKQLDLLDNTLLCKREQTLMRMSEAVFILFL